MDDQGRFDVRQIFLDFNPSTFVIYAALFLQSIVLSLRLDNVIASSYWLVFLPLWLWKCAVAAGATVGYATYCRRPEARHDGDSRRDIYAMSFAVLLQLMLLLFEILVVLRLDDLSSMPWRVVFVPIFLLVTFALVSCIFSCATERSIEIEIVSLVNLLLIIFISLRLDKVINWNWAVVFVPLWLFLAGGLVAGMYYLCTSIGVLNGTVHVASDRYCSSSFHGFVFLLVILPLLTFVILLAVALDGAADIPYVAVFVPLHVFFLALCGTSLYQRGGNPWWFGIRINFCTFLLAHCSFLQEYGNIVYKRPTEEDSVVRLEPISDLRRKKVDAAGLGQSPVPLAVDVPD